MKSSHFYRSCTSQTLWRLLIDWSLNYCFVKLGLFLLFCFLSLKMCSMDDLFISTPTYPPHHRSRLESQMALPEFSFEHLSPPDGGILPGGGGTFKEVGPMWQNSSLKMDFWRLHLAWILALCYLLPALMWSLPWWAEIWNLARKKTQISLPLVLLSGILWQQWEKHCLWKQLLGTLVSGPEGIVLPSVSMFRCPGRRTTLFCEMSFSVLYAHCVCWWRVKM